MMVHSHLVAVVAYSFSYVYSSFMMCIERVSINYDVIFFPNIENLVCLSLAEFSAPLCFHCFE